MKNIIAVLVRGMEQSVRVSIISVNPARVTGWQKHHTLADEELRDPCAPALPDWDSLIHLADAPVAATRDQYRGCGDVVVFAACAAARIGEVSGCRVQDIDTDQWIRTVRRQTRPAPGGLTGKGTKGKRARTVHTAVLRDATHWDDVVIRLGHEHPRRIAGRGSLMTR
ncbi:hypothetical protein [Streptomyces lavenduligriseus]|uniref:Integrase n=1 Tax=Streptomyces lavenduligriseus TaxID=67315 RepID=A0ABT0P597_9ACTN|nr:hypothetical protein [Streptomyces lavenduligriseus]MCL3998561.1 hypothetical protein [Streptomyces lavenduligriseus]